MKTLPVISIIFVAALCLSIPVQTASAGSATWNLTPASSDWNTATNWTPRTVPNGPNDNATFAASNTSEIVLQASVEVNSIVLNPGASAYTFTTGGGFVGASLLTISGTGVINNSGLTENFVNLGIPSRQGLIIFTNSATAGDGNIYTNQGTDGVNSTASAIYFQDNATAGTSTLINGGATGDQQSWPTQIFFLDSSSADHATIVNQNEHYTGGEIDFGDNATAGSATITNEGGKIAGNGYVSTRFSGEATADNSTIILKGSVKYSLWAFLAFYNDSHAGEATLIAEDGFGGGPGGVIWFFENSHGDRAHIQLHGNGKLDIGGHNLHPVTIGSLEGDGLVNLGQKSLAIGNNGLSTNFRGEISGHGSIIKIGQGRLSLTNANTYDGGTTVKRGILLVNNNTGSGTGTGPITVEAGTLGGTGTIAGPVSLGNGTDIAILSPGRGNLGTLTIQGALNCLSNSTYDFALNSSVINSDTVVANGVTIDGGAFSYVDNSNLALPIGTEFVIINNTAATPIAGTFNTLPDGSVITIGTNNFQANYEGGDGNDLALTVVSL